MKREEAEQVFGILAGMYDLHPERAAQAVTAWVPALEELDATIVMDIINSWLKGRGPDKLPPVPVFVADVKAEQKRRTPDADTSTAECSVCEDNGLVFMATADPNYPEESVPCPACSRGRAREFPLEKVGPWGANGFWRGRPWEKVGHVQVAFSEEGA